MKYRIITVLYVCLFSLKINSMTYSFTISETIDCYISLYNSTDYIIEIVSQESDDQLFSTVLSIGKYQRSDSKLIFKDCFFNYKFSFVEKDNYIFSSNSLPILNNKKIYTIKETSESSIYPWTSYEALTNKIKFNKEKWNTLYYGKYYCGDFLLDLRKGNTYVYYYKGIVLSKGHFKRYGLLILLKDTCLNHKFTFFIDKNSVVGLLVVSNKLMLHTVMLQIRS